MCVTALFVYHVKPNAIVLTVLIARGIWLVRTIRSFSFLNGEIDGAEYSYTNAWTSV